ncbi:unnamed protein product [Calypogeia fissa]
MSCYKISHQIQHWSPSLLRVNYKAVVHANCFESIKILLDGQIEFAAADPGKYTLLPENKELGDAFLGIGSGSEFPALSLDVAETIKALWKDPAIQATYERGNASAPRLYSLFPK